ncbi:MAG: peptidoglycan-binding protein, partial [Planctomycetota bacterium]|nr:peptidoglycan-binding protein [Planctomycetota bacterium]
MLVKNGPRLSLSITVAAAALLCGANFVEAQERRVNLPLGESAPTTPAPSSLESYVKTKWPLGRGSRGGVVKEMQKRLKDIGYNVGPDGVFGGDTMRALRKFQREAGLEDDGFFGKGTMKALIRAEKKKAEMDAAAAEPEAERPTVRPRPRPTTGTNSTVGMTGALSGNDTVPENTNLLDQVNDGRILRPGSKGSLVKDLQTRLNDAGFSVPRTGNFGPLTKRALQNFQRSKGLSPDGVFGPQSAAALVSNSGSGTPVSNAPSTGSWMQIARSQLGVREYSGSRNNPKIVEYHKTTIGRAND